MRPSRSGGSVPFASAAPSRPAPVIIFVPEGQINWDWELSDPPTWIVESSPTGEADWTFETAAAGDARESLGLSVGLFYRIAEADGDFNRTGEYSNVVQIES